MSRFDFELDHTIMNDNRIRRLGNYLTAAAVTLSLVFVGLEIRNNTIAARGATMQAISDTSSSMMTQVSLDADFAAILVRVFDGEIRSDFSPVENQQLNMNFVGFVRNLENTYLRHREGLVPDAVFESYGWNDNLPRTKYFAEFWADNAGEVVGPDFKQFFESRVQIGP